MMTPARPAPPPAWEKFARHDADGAIFSPSLQIALYADRPLSELAAGAVACHDLMIQQFGGELKLYHARSMRSARRFTSAVSDIFPTLCHEPATGLPEYRVFNGTSLQDFVPPVFATGAYAAYSWLQVHLPPSLAMDWDRVWALLTWMALPFPFRYGTIGYSLCWNEMSVDRDIEVPGLIGPLLKRYPGLNVGTARELCDQGMPPVNWVTLLGPTLLNRLGGVKPLREAFVGQQAIAVAALGEGAVIRAGEVPQLGDRNRKDDVPLYRRVGAHLKPLRGQQEIELDGLTLEESEAWLARFDC